ncbi:low-density lipoprotein receptor-related protein 3/10/12 [Mytilus galloprovincialis]|uniref:Low-density lipoprotein receptor-related protein 3/10/12 n=1 Tax=Mytilus galloprovincialis TaxID=29158 RepID=A0A8B6F504_MYTGA|nr:low-density lipoprotein receptor-related protein 3/10/12 [Mytilus galloprovincialis]
MLQITALIFILILQCYLVASFCKYEELTDRKGSIDIPFIRPAVYCHQWSIHLQPTTWESTSQEVVTVSFSQINIGQRSSDGTCGSNYLTIGGQAIGGRHLCGSQTPFVYISDMYDTKVLIKYYQNTSVADVGFTAKYTRGFMRMSSTCLKDEYKCSNGKCIYDSWRCNDANECGDNSDEIGCPTKKTTQAPTTTKPHQCEPGEISCRSVNWYNNICVEPRDQCDGHNNCIYGEDESNCEITTKRPVCDRSQILCRPIYNHQREECLDSHYKCDGKINCLGGEDENTNLCGYTTVPDGLGCHGKDISCRSSRTWQAVCLSEKYICDGNKDCFSGEDEDESICSQKYCNKYIEVGHDGGFITSPRYPNSYPDSMECVWNLHTPKTSGIQIRFKSFKLQDTENTDLLTVYDGPDSSSRLIYTYHGLNTPPLVIESTSSDLTIVFYSDSFVKAKGFNFTYQNKGNCLADQVLCGREKDCYETNHKCNGIWDCPLSGYDEKNCYKCGDQYTCGPHINQCYEAKQRCNGVGHCTNMMDELYCSSTQCGPHNGTFLCDNRRCIYETWKCDKTNDCGDNSDEFDCRHTSNLIKIAAVCGALICGLLLVVALGCTCKLYNLRVHGHRQRHETPLSRLYSEFMRRRAPPPYHEAMLTSRPYDEVRRDYLEHLQQTGNRPPSRRGRRTRNRNQPQTGTGNVEGESQNTSDNADNREPEEQDGLAEAQNSVNTDFERQNSNSLLILPESSSDESESDDNQNDSVQVSISEENVVTACYRRSSQNNKTESDCEDVDQSHSTLPDPDCQSADVCSVDATTIASCDSIDEASDKTIDIVVETLPRRRHNSEGSLNSNESVDNNSYGEFTIAENVI